MKMTIQSKLRSGGATTTRLVQQRLHQQEFRERVLEAYQRHCAVCRLKRDRLLEAAHIIADREERGAPVVSNGIALCSLLYHAAFDAHFLIAVRPDYRVEVREDVLHEADGPMLGARPTGIPRSIDSASESRSPPARSEPAGVRYEAFRRSS